MTTREQLDAILNRRPFRPFSVALGSGRIINVTKDTEVFSPRAHPTRIYVFTDDGLTHYFELEAIQSIVE